MLKLQIQRSVEKLNILISQILFLKINYGLFNYCMVSCYLLGFGCLCFLFKLCYY